MKKIILWGIIGCLIFVVGFLAGSFWTTMKFFGYFPKGGPGVSPNQSSIGSFDPYSNFYGGIYWDGAYKRTEELAPLPKGNATLKVRFSYDEKPAAGVKFLVALNGKYHTEVLTTGTNGEAEVSLPFGQWELNRLECRNWTAKPQGEFLLVSGDETKLGTSPLNELFFSFGHEGKTLTLSKDHNPNQTLAIEIKRRVELIWPSPGERKRSASIAESKIQWKPYPQAASYVVQISKVTHESARSTRFSPIIHQRVDNASAIALSQLPYVKSDGSPNEYAVEIRAYAKDGNFLSDTEHSFSTFTLTDNHILVEYDKNDGMAPDQDEVERRFLAGKTLEAAALLIKKEMYPEAGTLLEQTDASVMPGQLAMLKGYLNAAQGRCEEADKYFQEALSLGQKCIPESYQKGCKADQIE